MDTLKIYLRDVRKSQLLTKADELRLGARIQAGDMSAMQELVRANLRYVIAIAKGFKPCGGLDFEDYVQAGNIGLINAANKFDPARGYRFTTYATRCILTAITRERHYHSRLVRIPSHIWGMPDELEPLLTCYDTLENCVIAGSDLDPSEIVAEKEYHAKRLTALQHCMSRMTPRQREVLSRRAKGETLNSISSKACVTKERIRQIELSSLQQLAEWFNLERPHSSLAS